MMIFILSGIMCVGFIIFARKKKESPRFQNRANKIEHEIQQAGDKVFFGGGPFWGVPYQG